MPTDFESALISSLPGVLSVLRQRVGNEALANDILSQAVENALINEDKFTPGTNMSGWLMKIATNISINHYNSAPARREVGLPENYTDLVPGDLASAEMRIQLEEIFLHLEGLNDLARESLMLSAEGYTYNEIAELLHTTPKTVSVTLCRVRKRLADWL